MGVDGFVLLDDEAYGDVRVLLGLIPVSDQP
jgi:hypothetical protein